MAVKLVVCDVDGTLVDQDKNLTAATVAAVKRLEAAGVAFTLVSARPRSGMAPLLAPLGLEQAEVAAFNGGWISKGDDTVHHETIADDVARGVLAMADGSGADVWVFADDLWHATDGDGPHTRSERVSSDQEPVVADGFDAVIARADKITFVSDDEDGLHALYEKMHDRYGDRATIAQSQTYYLDVTPPTGNKGAAIATIAKTLGFDLSATVAIGDQANDLPMLERAGLSIAMGNAPDRVKAAADEVTLANDADGVAHAIDTIILPRLGASE